MADLPLFGSNVDKSKVPPIHQKRIINAFVNTFIIKTATFLEEFANQCEDKLLNFEIKLRQVDTQLKLIEEKLGTIPAAVPNTPIIEESSAAPKIEEMDRVVKVDVMKEDVPIEIQDVEEEEDIPVAEPEGVKAKDDYRYKKYFKMIHFGVPPAAIKMKLQAEGMDPDILDNPDKILPDGVIEPIAVDSDSSSD